jgi:hypothetical protein
MKKFTNYEESTNESIGIEGFVNKLIKENISLEISGEEKPWTNDIDVKANDKLVSDLTDYIEQEVYKANLNLLEKVRLSYYQHNSLDVIDEEIKNIRKNLKK